MLSAVLVAMLTIKVLYEDNDDQKDETLTQTTETTNISDQPTTTPRQVEADSDYPLWSILPYSGAGWTAEKYVDKLTLQIKLEGLKRDAAEKLIGDWLENNGFDRGSHKFMFVEEEE